MKYLFSEWERIERLIEKSPRILLLADYDGTLTPIVSRPKEAVLDKSLRKILKTLSKNKEKFYIGIISGRKLDDVKRKVRLDNIYYAGNHGLEIEGPGISFLHPSCRRFKPYLIRIKNELLSKTKGIKGAIVEYKAGSISLHYRLVKKGYIKRLRAIFNDVCAPYIKRGRIKISSGKKVWEIRLPIHWNKANAVDKILKVLKKRAEVFPIYLGDDKTDEDAFSFLKKRKALTIFVGKMKKSSARYYLKSPHQVKEFLIRLCQA